MSEHDGLAVYVIYSSPLDYPGKYVVRRQVATSTVVTPDPKPLGVVDTLDQARELLPIGLHRIERHPDDVAPIVETWL